jgi:hypothetical protein
VVSPEVGVISGRITGRRVALMLAEYVIEITTIFICKLDYDSRTVSGHAFQAAEHRDEAWVSKGTSYPCRTETT